MSDWLGRLFFGLGVALGVLSSQADPELAMGLFRRGGDVFVNASIAGAFSPQAIELARSGARLSFRIEVRVAGKGDPVLVEASRSMRYDPLARAFEIDFEPEGYRRMAPTLESAMIVSSQFLGLRLCPESLLAEGGSVELAAYAGLRDAEGAWHEAGILWQYERPSMAVRVGSITEVAF